MPCKVPNIKTKPSKVLRGHASQYFVAAELCRRGFIAEVTGSNCPTTDILCSNVAGTSFVHIQVKTFVPAKRGGGTCALGEKAEINLGDNFIWVITGFSDEDHTIPPVFYIIPSPVMALNIGEIIRNG